MGLVDTLWLLFVGAAFSPVGSSAGSPEDAAVVHFGSEGKPKVWCYRTGPCPANGADPGRGRFFG